MKIETVETFAKFLSKITSLDYWALIVASGGMGQGKSCLITQLARAIAINNKTPFNYNDNLTYSRAELAKWVDGDDKGKGQKPERSAIIADELISLFFKRNWYNSEQIDGIELLNKCRDRHLVILGSLPHFWDLDSAVLPIITYWIHIHERGRAWVFESDRNPFEVDIWHRKENRRTYHKHGNPYKCNGFVCEIHFKDFEPNDKLAYYNVRNTKRVGTEGQRNKVEKYPKLIAQRTALIKYIFKNYPETKRATIERASGCNSDLIRRALDA